MPVLLDWQLLAHAIHAAFVSAVQLTLGLHASPPAQNDRPRPPSLLQPRVQLSLAQLCAGPPAGLFDFTGLLLGASPTHLGETASRSCVPAFQHAC